MDLQRLICASAVVLASVTTPGQTSAGNALPASSRDHFNNDRFGIVTSVRGLPLGVRDELQSLFGSTYLDIAEPGAPFRAADVVTNANLPTRRLALAACSIDHCLVYYERGGIAHTWHVMLLHWTPEKTRLEWGGAAPGGLTTIDALRKAVLSGTITKSTSW